MIVENFDTNIKKIELSPSYKYDPLFADVVTYENDIDGRLGIDKCLENCSGKCLEYGITGTAYCFSNPDTTTFTKEIEQKFNNTSKLSYPNMR